MVTPPETAPSEADRWQAAAELQDLLVHGLAALNIQAGAALALLDRDPDRARDALMAISTLARQAMGELRRLRLVLGAEDAAPRRPQPRLGDAVGFVLPASAQLAVCRVVEAVLQLLPDVGDPELTVRAHAAAVTIDVRAHGSWGAASLEGLETRVRLYGGTVQRLTADEGGLNLRVELPVDDGA